MALMSEQAEEKLVFAARNALIIAGREMGAEGDHWPVIKATVNAIMKDWEELKVLRNVDEELKLHLGVLLEKLEHEVAHCAPEVRAQAAKELAEMQEVYEAYFSEIDKKAFDAAGMEMPPHVLRAEAIIDTLEADND